jgi:type I restriction enzyme S subunit
MSICATIGRPVIVDMPACIHDGFVQFYDVNNDDKEYMYYLLQFHEKDLERKGQPGTQVNLNTTIVENFEAYFPNTIPEQRIIARILSTVDAVIEKTEAAIAKYKAIKVGMMRDFFTRGIDLANGKLRPSYTDAPELYQQSELGMVPKEWDVVRIDQVSTFVTNGFVGVATPHYESRDNGVKYLFGTNVRKDEITFDDVRYVSRLFHNKQVKSQLRTGDMLTVQSGHIGTSAIVPENLGDANCHALIITRFVLPEIFPWFISYYLNSDMGMHGLEKLFIGSTIQHINTSELAKHLILKPAIEEQKEISKKINSIDALLRNEFMNFSKMQDLKQALMSDLLTGNVRVKHEDEIVEAIQ